MEIAPTRQGRVAATPQDNLHKNKRQQRSAITTYEKRRTDDGWQRVALHGETEPATAPIVAGD